MPTIRSSADLRNNYNEISTFCHDYSEPVFITKSGKGNLSVMSIEAYEQLVSRFELYGEGRSAGFELAERRNDYEQKSKRKVCPNRNPGKARRQGKNQADCREMRFIRQ